MKGIFLIVSIVMSFSLIAKTQVKIEFKSNETKPLLLTDTTDFDQTKLIELRESDLKIEYSLSNKKPSDYPAEYEWNSEMVLLNAKIVNQKTNKVIASSQISTMYGETARMTSRSTDKEGKRAYEYSLKFTPKKLD